MKTEKPEPDAAQLLKMPDLQIELKRQKRLASGQGRGVFRVFMRVLILLVLVGMTVATLLCFYAAHSAATT